MPLFPISNYQPILNKKYLSKALMGRKDIKQKMNQTQTAMQIFEYQGNEVRTIQHGDEVWWVLRDVCRVLSLSNPHKVAERLEEDERNLIPLIDSMGRTQKNTIVNEPGLYETEKAAIVDFEHTHDDRYYTEAEMNTKLNAKEPAFTKNNAFNKNFGTAAGTVCQGNDSRLSNARRASNITMSLSGTTLTINYS